MDAHKRLYIKGRMKNTIIGASGENIYPEDIESVINNNQFVVESLVFEEDGYLVAKILLDLDELEKNIEHIKSVIEEKKIKGLHTIHELDDKYKVWSQHILKKEINNKLNRVSQIKRVDLIDKPLEKTATHKIKRFCTPNILPVNIRNTLIDTKNKHITTEKATLTLRMAFSVLSLLSDSNQRPRDYKSRALAS